MTTLRSVSLDDGTVLVTIAIKSTEAYPTNGLANGSEAIETDTGNYSLFDGANWNLMCTIKE